MEWFGTDWGAPICREVPQVPVPVGQACYLCGAALTAQDTGVTMPFAGASFLESTTVAAHLRCFFRVLGIDQHAGEG
jgi:hypothetical protein